MVEVLARDIGEDDALVIVEDAHWIDSARWQLLAQVYRRCSNLRFLAASRTRTKDALTDDAAGLLFDPETARPTLAPLTSAATGALVAQTLSAKPLRLNSCPGSLSIAKAILSTLQINRHLEEIGSILVRDGHVVIGRDYESYRDIPLPGTVEDALAARVLVASELDQMVLRIASAQGRRFQEGLVAALLPDEMAELDIGTALARLHDAALVDRAEAPGDWQFQHALIREATYGLLTRAQKGHLHGRIAPLLAQ
ncbi:MAG: hypothetical protein MK180_06075 [Rhodobacteraceae bacterium]|nr:hypothetical protein [Paracoccaceae bacterium]